MDLTNPVTVKAITRARAALRVARGQWVSDEDDDDDPASEAEQLGADAVAHLDAGRWDEARVCADAALTLAEDNGKDAIWREFALLVEEAAELGRTDVV